MMSWMVESCKTRMWRAGMGGLAQPRAGSDTVLMVHPNFVAPRSPFPFNLAAGEAIPKAWRAGRY